MDLVKINLSRPVRLQLEGDPVLLGHGLQGVRLMPEGVQEVEQPIADHWFVKAHCVPLPEPDPVETTSQALDNFVAAVTAGELAEQPAEAEPVAADAEVVQTAEAPAEQPVAEEAAPEAPAEQPAEAVAEQPAEAATTRTRTRKA